MPIGIKLALSDCFLSANAIDTGQLYFIELAKTRCNSSNIPKIRYPNVMCLNVQDVRGVCRNAKKACQSLLIRSHPFEAFDGFFQFFHS